MTPTAPYTSFHISLPWLLPSHKYPASFPDMSRIFPLPHYPSCSTFPFFPHHPMSRISPPPHYIPFSPIPHVFPLCRVFNCDHLFPITPRFVFPLSPIAYPSFRIALPSTRFRLPLLIFTFFVATPRLSWIMFLSTFNFSLFSFFFTFYFKLSCSCCTCLRISKGPSLGGMRSGDHGRVRKAVSPSVSPLWIFLRHPPRINFIGPNPIVSDDHFPSSASSTLTPSSSSHLISSSLTLPFLEDAFHLPPS